MIEKYEQIRDELEFLLQSEWKSFMNKTPTSTYKLKELVSYSNTGADAIQKAPIVDYPTNYKCVRVGDFTNNRNYIDWGYCELSDDIFEQYRLRTGDVLITRTASIGMSKYISVDLDAVYNNGIIRLKSNEKVLPLILYLICSTDDFIGYIKGIEAGSSTRPNMKINFLLDYVANIPNIDIQLKIIDKLEKYIKEKDDICNKILSLNKIKKYYLDKHFK